MDIEAIKKESKEHSASPTNWSTDALLKEFLWALHHYYTSYCCFTEEPYDRVSIAHKELKNRVQSLEKEEDREKGFDLINSLMKAQMKIKKYSSRNERNKYVYDLCYLLDVRGAMSSLMLP